MSARTHSFHMEVLGTHPKNNRESYLMRLDECVGRNLINVRIRQQMQRVLLMLWLFCIVSFATLQAHAQQTNVQRGSQNYQAIIRGEKDIRTLTEEEKQEVFAVTRRLQAQDRKKGPPFQIVQAMSDCKYFVVEQQLNYSLVDAWSCSRPQRGDMGNGEVKGYGTKQVLLNAMPCTLFVEDGLLSQNRAAEKFVEKCGVITPEERRADDSSKRGEADASSKGDQQAPRSRQRTK